MEKFAKNFGKTSRKQTLDFGCGHKGSESKTMGECRYSYVCAKQNDMPACDPRGAFRVRRPRAVSPTRRADRAPQNRSAQRMPGRGEVRVRVREWVRRRWNYKNRKVKDMRG